MSSSEIILGIISIISFLIGLYSFIQSEIRKTREKANVAILKEKLTSVYNGISSLYHTADAIVQIPKMEKEVRIEEMQNLARVLRGQLLSHATLIKESREKISDWKYGEMVQSSNSISEELIKENAKKNE